MPRASGRLTSTTSSNGPGYNDRGNARSHLQSAARIPFFRSWCARDPPVAALPFRRKGLKFLKFPASCNAQTRRWVAYARNLHDNALKGASSPLIDGDNMNVRVLPPAQDEPLEDDRVALSKEAFKHAFLDNLFYVQGKIPALATKRDYYMALAYTVRDRMLHRWISTAETYTPTARGPLPTSPQSS